MIIPDIDALENVKTTFRAELEQNMEGLHNQPYLLRKYLSCVSNKYRFLPGYSHETDEDFFKKLEEHRHAGEGFEPRTHPPALYELIDAEGDMSFMEDIHEKPYMFVSFHYGSYASIGLWLFMQQIPICGLTREGVTRDMIFKDVPEEYDLGILETGGNDVMLTMMSQFQQKKSMLVLADIMGVPNSSEVSPKSHIKLPFLNQEFYFKKGAVMLAYSSGVPIVPVVSERNENGRITLRFLAPIRPTRKVSREEFVQQTLKICFEFFDKTLKKLPSQWDYWHMVQLFAENNYQEFTPRRRHIWDIAFEKLRWYKNDIYRFNTSLYEIIEAKNRNYLYNRRDHSCFTISPNLTKYLRILPAEGISNKIMQKQIKKMLLQDLVQRNVIIGQETTKVSNQPNIRGLGRIIITKIMQIRRIYKVRFA
jgi:lauroyl/myristoyl acyltransferase